MRKLFLFILIFAVGFAALYWIDRGSGPVEEQQQGEPSEEEAAQSPTVTGEPGVPAGKPAEDPIEEATGQDQAQPAGKPQITVAPSGALRFDLFDPLTHKRVHSFQFANIVPQEDGFYDAEGVDIQSFDPETGELKITYAAQRAHLKIKYRNSVPFLDDDGNILFYDVVVTQHNRGAGGPLQFTLPTAAARILKHTTSFRSVGDELAHVVGDGLEAQGRGLRVSSGQPFLLSKGGVVHLSTPQAGRVTFSTPKGGKITVQSLGPVGARAVELSATGGARLEMEGSGTRYPAGVINSASMTLFGRVGAGGFHMESGNAFGSVSADFPKDKPKDHFESRQARVTFDKDGRIEKLVLSGDPKARMVIDGPAGKPHPVTQEREATQVVLLSEGEGDLTVLMGREIVQGEGGERIQGTGTAFRQAGPAQLRSPDLGLVIDAESEIGGHRITGMDRGGFFARGKVRVSEGRRVLTTARIEGTLGIAAQDPAGPELTASERTVADVVCRGRTHFFDGTSESRQFDLLSEGRCELSMRGKAWFVPFAQAVQIAVEGLDPYTATTKVLRDYDSQAGTFSAEGDVVFANSIGVAHAVRARAIDREHLELYGLPDRPARFEVHTRPDMLTFSGVFDALQIDVSPHKIVVSKQVTGDLRTSDRTFHVEADWAQLTVDEESGVELPKGAEEPGDEEQATAQDAAPRPFRLEARVVREVRATEELEGRPAELLICSCDDLVITGVLAVLKPEPVVEPEEGADKPRAKYEILNSELVATGSVKVDYKQAFAIQAFCERFTLNEAGQGLMESSSVPGETGRKVTTEGRMAGNGLPYRMTSDEVLFDDGYLEAKAPRVFLEAPLLPIVGNDPLGGFTHAEADWMRGDASGVLFEGSVRVEGTDRSGKQLILESAALKLTGNVRDGVKGAIEPREAISSIDAWGGFTAVYEEDAQASGEAFNMTKDRLLLTGRPSDPAKFGIDDYVVVSEFIQLDLHTFLMSAAQGHITNERGPGGWRMDFASMQPQRDGGDSILVISQPLSRVGNSQTRASWAVIWVKADVWTRHGLRMLWTRKSEREGEQQMPTMPRRDLVDNPIRVIVEADLERFFNQIYLEGDVETLSEGRRVARAESLLLDLRENTGWMRDAQVEARVEAGKQLVPIFVSSEELQMRADGVLIAENAKVTTCDHAKPHYTIEVGKLELEPRVPGESQGWRFNAHDNMLKIGSMLQLPLPPLGHIVLDDEGDVEGFETSDGEVFALESLFMGSSARHGTSVGTGLRTEIGTVGSNVGGALGFDKNHIDGHWDFDVHYMGSRGLLLGVGLDLRDKTPGKSRAEQPWLNMYASGIADDGRDRGFVRVDPSDRDGFRSLFHGYGRYPMRDGEWFGVSFAVQSDPGVQSEFFEKTFETYELRDDYLHWRKAKGATFYDADMQVRANSFRSEVERLPSAGFYRGATPIAELGSLRLLYTTSLDADYMRRRQGNLGAVGDTNPTTGMPMMFTEFYEDQYTDGLGDRELLRVDNYHRIETPFSLGGLGLRMDPYLEGRLTGWDRDRFDEEVAARAALFAGAEIGTTFWKRDGARLQSLTPSIGYRGTLIHERTDAIPVRFDAVEDLIEGQLIDAGLRYTWNGGDKRALDLEIRLQHLTDQGTDIYDRDYDGDTTDEVADAQRLLVLSEHRFDVGGIPFATRLDGRYDWEIHDSSYLRAILAFAPHRDLPMEFSYTQGPRKEFLGVGVDPDPSLPDIDHLGRLNRTYEGLEDDERLFQAIGARTRWTVNPKWEIELRETFSMQDDGRLNSRAMLRRFGHDMLVEFTVGYRADEGSVFSITFRPLLGWRQRPLGILR